MNKHFRAACGLSAALLLSGFALAGCGSSGSSGSSAGTGTMSVRMADAPIDAEHVNVTFSRVEAHGPDGWKTLFDSSAPGSAPITLDLKQLVLTDVQLASGPLPAGHYDQIRLMITEVELVKADGSTFGVTVPSGLQTGIKINVNADVPPNAVTELLCDFNVARSVVETPPGSNNFLLKPVIPAVVKVMSGTLTGTVMLDGTTPAPNAVVEVFPANAERVETNMVNSSQTLEDGTFKVWALLGGTYDIRITSADGTMTQTLPAVQVTAAQDTALGTVTLAPAPPAP
jgi:hypothetical protein